MNILKSFSNLFTKQSGVWSTFFSSIGSPGIKPNNELYFGTVFACVDTIATTISETQWGLYKKNGDEWEEVKEHPLISLFSSPNNYQTSHDILYLISSHIDTNGQSFLYPVKSKLNNEKVLQLHVLNPNLMKTGINENSVVNEITKYTYVKNGNTYNFKPDEIINILRPNPYAQLTGISTIRMAAYEGTSELNALNMNNAFYNNGAFPSGVISTDNELKPDVYQKLKQKIKENYEGKHNAFKMMFLSHGMKYQAITPTQKDIEYVAQRKLNRDQILSIFKVPKSLMAISDNVNKATAEVEYRAFMETVIKPRLEMIFDKLNRFLVPIYGNEYEFRYVNPIPDDEAFKLEEKIASVNNWRTVNEIRADEGLEPLDGYDTIQSFGFTPDETPDEPEEEKHIHKAEELPTPNKVDTTKAKDYIKRRNAYMSYKEVKYSLALRQHFNHLIRDVGKKSIDNPTEDEILAELLPTAEKQNQWKILLYGLILRNNIEVYKTVQKQLKEVYGLEPMMSETIDTINASRATFSAKSVSDTVYNQIKEIIRDNVASGKTGLREIKNDITSLLSGQKEWKVEQIARTEISWAYGDAQQKIYRANDIEKVKWVAGAGACEICRQNDGKVVGVNELFPSGHVHEPAHINCRCEVIPLII